MNGSVSATAALYVPAGVIIASLLSYIALRRTARETLETQRRAMADQVELSRLTLSEQRRLAQDDRVWEKRSELYLEILELTGRVRRDALLHTQVASSPINRLVVPSEFLDVALTADNLSALESRTFAFGSQRCIEAFEGYLITLQRMETGSLRATQSFSDLGPRPTGTRPLDDRSRLYQADVRALNEMLVENTVLSLSALEELRRAIRGDLSLSDNKLPKVRRAKADSIS